MELRTAASPRDVKHYTTDRLREEFLINDLFQPDVIKLVYSHIDRIITGSAVPVKEVLELTAGDELRAAYFCERRELGVINIGGAGTITVDDSCNTIVYVSDGTFIATKVSASSEMEIKDAKDAFACKRATTLHTEQCYQEQERCGTVYCYAACYGAGFDPCTGCRSKRSI